MSNRTRISQDDLRIGTWCHQLNGQREVVYLPRPRPRRRLQRFLRSMLILAVLAGLLWFVCSSTRYAYRHAQSDCPTASDLTKWQTP